MMRALTRPLRLALVLALAPVFALAQEATAPKAQRPSEQIVAGLSRDNIGITTSFDGSQILIYGAIKREAPEPANDNLAVIVTLEGPLGPITIRRKSRELGIWVNTASLGVASAPSYYAVATSGPLQDILDPRIDVQQRISIPLAMRAFSGPVQVSDTKPFTEAMIRIRERQGLYKLETGGVRLVDNTLFRADFELPANLIEGAYKTRIFLLRDGQLVDRYQSAIEVRKVGLERWLYALAHQHAALYGLLALALAVVAGWAAAAVFRFVR
ncbi:TIGR02186 family protein [Thioclava sp.]|uniref:TIGR02186 family protein n=1 Tax=Thioclava sp. TaxID=1933450 RepID=UPI003AA8F284